MCSPTNIPPHASPGKTCWESVLGRENGVYKGPELGGDLAHSGTERRSARPLQSEMRKEEEFRDQGRVAQNGEEN